MYDDSPDWRLMTALFQCLYHSHPIRHDIAGTVESIAEITPEMLYDCCRAFTAPAIWCWRRRETVTAEQVLAACERAKLPARPVSMRRLQSPEPPTVAREGMEFSMPLAKACLGVGFKEGPVQGAKAEVICDMLTELIWRRNDPPCTAGCTTRGL